MPLILPRKLAAHVALELELVADAAVSEGRISRHQVGGGASAQGGRPGLSECKGASRARGRPIYFMKKLLIACTVTCRCTAAMLSSNGISFGHTSTQFCA